MNKKYFKILLLGLLVVVGIELLLTFFNKEETPEEVTIDEKQFNAELFDTSSSFYRYEDGKYSSVLGIDVSEHNGRIDFNKVKENGIDFVIIRCGRRGYAKGIIYSDSYFEEYYQKAKEADLKVGVYFFSQAINENEAIEEAQYTLEMIKDKKLDLGVSYDLEKISYDESRTDYLSKEQATANALAFFNTIGTKQKTMLYTNHDCLETFFDIEQLSNHDIWYAQYYTEPQCDYKIKIWQYTDEGTLPGLYTSVDINMMFIEK